jgi:hypothetical protein
MIAAFSDMTDDEFSLAWFHLSDRERSAIDPAQLASISTVPKWPNGG